VIVAISVVVGLVLGLLFRWWALVAALAVGVWIGATTDVDEVPEWFSASLMPCSCLSAWPSAQWHGGEAQAGIRAGSGPGRRAVTSFAAEAQSFGK